MVSPAGFDVEQLDISGERNSSLLINHQNHHQVALRENDATALDTYRQVNGINQRRRYVTGDAHSSEGRPEGPCVTYLCVYGAVGTDFMESN
jgi:hypothetical protein